MATPEIRKTVEGLLRLEDKKPFAPGEEKTASSLGLAEVIYRRLTSTKFRKSKVGSETEGLVRNYLAGVVDRKEPLNFLSFSSDHV